MPTDNPLADPTRREELRKKLGVYGMQSLTLQEFYLYLEDALRLLDEQDRRIAALKQERDALRGLVREGYGITSWLT